MVNNSVSNIPLFIKSVLENPALQNQIACHKILPGCPESHGTLQKPFLPAIERILKAKNIILYDHQALAMDHIRAGHNIVIATPTASGKSLIYNLPILERHLLDNESTAIYLFPLKALAQDQFATFNNLVSEWPNESQPRVTLYDGDTPEAERKNIRKNPPSVLMTNPEMLHFGILPHHQKWAAFLASLTHIVVDEAHVYRGVFGSHMAQVFQRLNRIVTRYGTMPQYIFCTATLGNPADLASSLMGGNQQEPVAILKSGAPQGKRHFLFMDPLHSPATCAIDLLKKAIQLNLRTIVYCQSRKMTELISMWATEAQDVPANAISSYRAGFLPHERRQIEKQMSEGELKAVISTSALELGIDIGGLDLCILVGYPGTVMQTLQRGGRVGRARQESAVVLIAGDDALDQYFIHHPEEFFTRPSEKAIINPDNESILLRHLECAASEIPLTPDEPMLENPFVQSALAILETQGLLKHLATGEWIYTGTNPQRKIDLRSGGVSYAIEDANGYPIGTIDGFRAWKETHPGAVYLHHGKSYIIENLDNAAMRIIAKPARVNWFTRSRGNKSTDILKEEERKIIGNAIVSRGKLRVTEIISGYEKRSTQGQQLLTIVPLTTPPRIFETEGLWITIPDELRKELENRFVHFMGSIHSIEHAIIGLLPLEVMADRNDFGGISIPMHPQLGLAAVFIYDAIPGGAGLCKSAYQDFEHILQATLENISNCRCEDGCPSCIHSPKCGAGNRPLSKAGAISLLESILLDSGSADELFKDLQLSPAPERIAKKEVFDKKTGNLSGFSSFSSKKESFFEKLANSGGFSAKSPIVLKKFAPTPPERYVVFDVETRRSAKEVGGWQNASKMGVSVAVLYESATDSFYGYQQNELDLLFEKMSKADLIIGFNSFRFDYEVLAPFLEISQFASYFSLKELPGLDLLQRVRAAAGARISLDNLCQATLNAQKSADGLQALRWWQCGELDKIRKYCQRDVELTRDLYLTGLEKGEVAYKNKAGAHVKIKVDFSMRN